jgi:flagellar assembly factor FliW
MSETDDAMTPPTAAAVLLDAPASSGAPEPIEITFAGGLPGFDHLRTFVVEPMPGDLAPFCRLRAVDPQGVEFIVVPPGLVFPDYTVEVDEETVERLDLAAEDAVVLTIVTVGEDGSAPTANLLGPVIVNRRTRTAAQVVLHGSGYDVAVPLSPGA